MKKRLPTILLVLIFFIGLCVLLYPTVSDYWNSITQSRAINAYEKALSQLTQKDYADLLQEANDYNEALRALNYPMATYGKLSENGEIKSYAEILNINGDGIMGYISIDKIGVLLPIYHGISEAVLNTAAGHMEGTSLPVGGPGTHSVMSAHRGLPSAMLFTHLDRLVVGDIFTLTVLDRVLTYEVDSVLIVNPDEVETLQIAEGEDHVTLVTCTPYGINTHRLLVRGTRIENIEEKPMIYVPADMVRIDALVVTPVVAVPMLLLLLIVLLVRYRKR